VLCGYVQLAMFVLCKGSFPQPAVVQSKYFALVEEADTFGMCFECLNRSRFAAVVRLLAFYQVLCGVLIVI